MVVDLSARIWNQRERDWKTMMRWHEKVGVRVLTPRAYTKAVEPWTVIEHGWLVEDMVKT